MRKYSKLIFVSLLILLGCGFLVQAFIVEDYSGYIVSVDPDKGEFLLSVTCTRLNKWSSECAEANPEWWQLLTRFQNLFRDPHHVRVITNNDTEYESYDIHIPASFSGLKPHTFVAVKGDLSQRGFLGFGMRTLIAEEIIVPRSMSWYGRLISIENDKKARAVKILNLKSESGADIKVHLAKEALLINTEGQEISMKDLSLTDNILSGWGRKYNIEWQEGTRKIKAIKSMEVVAEEVVLIGKATGEGEEIKEVLGNPEVIKLDKVGIPNKLGELFCQEGLTRIEVIEKIEIPNKREGQPPTIVKKQRFYCTKCGDGVCKEPEAEYNCPEDCAKISLKVGDNFNFMVVPDKESFDLNKKTFKGDIKIKDVIVLKGVKFIVTDSTQIFRAMAGDEDLTGPWREYFSLSELRDMSGTELFYGVPRAFTVRIMGKVLTSERGEIVVEVNKIAKYVQ